jgi:hypothetical protein
MRLVPLAILAAGAALAATPARSDAQCSDRWVTNAILKVTGRAPRGSGNSGDCAITNFGGGHWDNEVDLVGKVIDYFPRALTTSSDGTNGAYCVSTSGASAQTGACDRGYEVFRTRWSPSSRPSGRIVITKSDGTCLTAAGDGQPVRTLPCDNGPAQDWTFASTGQIESQQFPGKCLDVEGGLGMNRRVLLWGCGYGPDALRPNNQRFALGFIKPRALLSNVQPSLQPMSQLLQSAFRLDPRGGNVVAAGGMNVVSAGGGNVVAAGGANVVSAGGANVVAAGGLN